MDLTGVDSDNDIVVVSEASKDDDMTERQFEISDEEMDNVAEDADVVNRDVATRSDPTRAMADAFHQAALAEA